MACAPFIVGIGGTNASGSSTECALRLGLDAAASEGASVQLFDGPALARLPYYGSGAGDHVDAAALVSAIRAADGLLIASPAYHGSISGLVKNAIDYVEETARDARVYLDGVPIGLIVTAYGWQATGSTLAALRSIVHALRGWPTPFGAAINVATRPFADGRCADDIARSQLQTVGRQVVAFAKMRAESLIAQPIPAVV